MTRYETINSLGAEFMKLTGKGLIPLHILDWKVYYESYLEEMDYQRRHFKKTAQDRRRRHRSRALPDY